MLLPYNIIIVMSDRASEILLFLEKDGNSQEAFPVLRK